MTTPFFSIVIPTKGRSFLVGGAIESVLRQSHPDFEIVVVDNDDSDATARTVSQFKDRRVRHHRTGGLSMPDNWEAACAQGRGEYLLILEDKQALRGQALERIRRLVDGHHPSCLKWKADILDDTTRVSWMEEVAGTGEARFISSVDVLRTFLSGAMSESWDLLPIGHMSAFSRKLRADILSGPRRRLCPPVSPDYTLGIQAVAFGEGVMFIDAPLVAMSRRHSNGRSLIQKSALGRQFISEIGGANHFWSRTPIQAAIVPASLFNDFLELQAIMPERLNAVPFDWINYYVETWRFLVWSQGRGIPVSEDFAAFSAALANETKECQQMVWEAITQRVAPPARSRLKNRIRAFRRRTGLLALEEKWKLFQRWISGRRHVGRFKSPIEFVSWADQQMPQQS